MDPDKEWFTWSYRLSGCSFPLSPALCLSPAARCRPSSHHSTRPPTSTRLDSTMASAALPKRIIKVSLPFCLLLSVISVRTAPLREGERGTSPPPPPTAISGAELETAQTPSCHSAGVERQASGPNRPNRLLPPPSAGRLETAVYHHLPRLEEKDPTALTPNSLNPIPTGNSATRRRFSTRDLGHPARRQPAIL